MEALTGFTKSYCGHCDEMKATERKWLSHHSAHDYEALMQRWNKLAKNTGLEIVSLCQQGKFETIAVCGNGGGEIEGLYLSAGVHGDEPAAVWGLLEWAEANLKILKREIITILPCVNPWGFANNVRMDNKGRDLNRLFHTNKLPFFRAWRKMMGDQQFRVALNLHEDYDAQGIYVYELVPRGMKISDKVFDRIESIIPRETRAKIEDQRIKGGIIRRSGDFRRVIEEELDGGYPEAIYLYLNHTKVALTFETPSEFAFHERVKAQKEFIECVVKSR